MAARKKKTTTRRTKTTKRSTVTDATDQHTIGCIDGTAKDVHDKILKKHAPELKSPVRSLSNVRYDPKVGYLETLSAEDPAGWSEVRRLFPVELRRGGLIFLLRTPKT